MQRDTKTILNLGCGKNIMPEAINVDIFPGEGVNRVCDISVSLPFQDQSMTHVHAYYILCQICDPQKFKHVMNEIWRVLKPNGWLYVRVPDARFPAAWQDPMDCRRFVKESFDYLDKDHYRFKEFYYGFKPWRIISIKKEKKDRLFVTMRKSISV